jgi:hypothetical protein
VNNQNTEPLLLDVVAAAAIVGVSVGIIRGWVADGLPFVRAGRGGRKMFTRRDLERFVERQKEQSEPLKINHWVKNTRNTGSLFWTDASRWLSKKAERPHSFLARGTAQWRNTPRTF